MTEHLARRVLRWSVLAVVSMTAVCVVLEPAPASEARYIPEDAGIAGRQIHYFAEGDENVFVVLRDFSFMLGDRFAGGRSAVVWVRQYATGRIIRHEMTIYIEGDPKAGGFDVLARSNETILLRVRNQGRLTAKGVLVPEPLKDLAVYARAVAARRRQATAATRPTHPAPELIAAWRSPDDPATRPAYAPPGPATREPPLRTAPPREPKPVEPVTYRSDHWTIEELDDKSRVGFFQGNVYLSQGSPDSDLFLELRSQDAVIFFGKSKPKDKRVPYVPQVGALETSEGEETITGVYLRNDVVIGRGERYTRASEAYYDFTTDRAIMIDPVFRTIQKQRNIPIYVRAEEVRMLSARQMWFRKAKVTTSDFYTPSYAIGASTAYVMDTTPYDEKGVRLSEYSYATKLRHTTFDIRGVPVLYWPYTRGELEESNTALRKVQVGREGRFGYGVETQWHLFRLLGLVRPSGFKGKLDLDWYEHAALVGVNVDYARRQDKRRYSGYWMAYGLLDRRGKDNLGQERDHIPAPKERGRLLVRHKEYLRGDWTAQLELSYICDRNFLEQYFPSEFRAGKEQETLIYLKKQRDNWAFTTLLQQRMNRFLTQTESAPDLGFYLIGEPLWSDRLTLYSESHAGMKRFRPDKGSGRTDSRMFARLDTRQEIDMPLQFGPLNLLPYAVGRATYWDDAPVGGKQCRPYGQLGLRAMTQLWRVYDNVESRLWDVHRLRHIVTPHAGVFLADTSGVHPEHLFPMDPDIERHLPRQSGWHVGLSQRLQTRRGEKAGRRTVDWMRLDMDLGGYDTAHNTMPGDGRFFPSRPEYSLARNHFNTEYVWHISDSTSFLSYTNYDIDSGKLQRTEAGLTVQRNPRLRYHLGASCIGELDSSIGTFGVNYAISRKYSVSFFERYDFDFDGGRNLSTTVTFVRKLPRWFAGLTFVYDATTDSVSLYLAFWPEGLPEVRIGSGRTTLLGESSKN